MLREKKKGNEENNISDNKKFGVLEGKEEEHIANDNNKKDDIDDTKDQ